jgi:hypothetical protein
VRNNKALKRRALRKTVKAQDPNRELDKVFAKMRTVDKGAKAVYRAANFADRALRNAAQGAPKNSYAYYRMEDAAEDLWAVIESSRKAYEAAQKVMEMVTLAKKELRSAQ